MPQTTELTFDTPAEAEDFFAALALFAGRPDLAQIAAAVTAHQPSRDDLLSLASIQARAAADAIDGGDVAAGHALLLEALGFIERAVGGSRG